MMCEHADMVLVALVLVVALTAGMLQGGRLRNLGRVRLRAPAVVVLAVVLQLGLAGLAVVTTPPLGLTRALLAGSYAALIAFVVANRRLPGMMLVLVGLGLNAAVIVANGGMPVAPGAVEAVGGDAAAIGVGAHRRLTETDVLGWLADIIPIPPLRTVVSVGDIFLATGVGILAAALMRGLPGRRRAEE